MFLLTLYVTTMCKANDCVKKKKYCKLLVVSSSYIHRFCDVNHKRGVYLCGLLTINRLEKQIKKKTNKHKANQIIKWVWKWIE